MNPYMSSKTWSTNSIAVKAGYHNLNDMVASQTAVMEVTQSQGPPWHEQFSFPIEPS